MNTPVFNREWTPMNANREGGKPLSVSALDFIRVNSRLFAVAIFCQKSADKFLTIGL